MGSTVPSLLELAIETVANKIDSYHSLDCIPEDLVCIIFEIVLQKGKLNPHNLKLFKDTEYPLLLTRTTALNIRDPPPRVASSDCSWLGDHPKYY